MPAPGAGSHDRHLAAAFAQPVEIERLHAAVGDDPVDSFQLADLAEPAPSEFRAVGQHHDLLRGLDHRTVERGFEHVGRCQPEFEVDAVHADEEFAAIEVAEHRLGEGSHDRNRTAAGDAAQLNHIDIGVLRQDPRHGDRRRDDRQMPLRLDFAGQEGHGRSRGDDDRVLRGDQGGGGNADGLFFGDVFFLFFIDVAVADIGADQDGAAVRTIQFFLLFEVGEILADGHLRHPEEVGELRHRDRSVLLQKSQDPVVPFREAQKRFFADFVHVRSGIFVFQRSIYKNFPENHAPQGRKTPSGRKRQTGRAFQNRSLYILK